jgi:hypothetical protein
MEIWWGPPLFNQYFSGMYWYTTGWIRGDHHIYNCVFFHHMWIITQR